MPVWINDNTIIYRKYSNDEQGYLYAKEIDKDETKLDNVFKNSYNPKFNDGQIIYWESKSEGVIHKFNYESEEDSLVKSNYVYPEYISKNEILAVSTYECKEECNESNYDKKIELYLDEVVRIDLEENEMYDLTISPEVFKNELIYF